MTVRDILDRLSSGDKLAGIASSIGQSSTWLQRRLKSLGYAWDNSSKAWFFTLEGEQPLDLEINSRQVHKRDDSYSHKVRMSVNQPSQKVASDAESNSHTFHHKGVMDSQGIHMQFTPEEVRILKDFASRRMGDIGTKLDLVERVYLLPSEEKERRTVLGLPSLLTRLDSLSERTKIDKSDLWAIALQDLLDRYDV